MKSFIAVVDNVLSGIFCADVITKFEKNEYNEQDIVLWNDRNFVEVNITTQSHWLREHEIMVNVIEKLQKIYVDNNKILIGSQWPKSFGYEQFHLRRYLEKGDAQYFGFHTDVTSYSSSRRFLSFLWYLNDVTDGGRTEFLYSPDGPVLESVEPKIGRVLMFPSVWTHPHRECFPISGPKYVISGYLHYL